MEQFKITTFKNQKFSKVAEVKNTQTRSNKSWKAVTKGIKYYEQGKYGKALALLFKYEDVEARAMFLLACMYLKGLSVIENMKKATDYLQKLIIFQDRRPEEEGLLAMAYYYLGDLYYRGIVLAKDDVEAEKHWRQGAVLNKDPDTENYHFGTAKCQTALAMFYSDPKKKMEDKAFYWHKKAVESGSIISEGAIGVMYMYGIGTEVNLELAYNHLTNAAVYDNVYAKGYLTAYYYNCQMYHRTVSLGRELAQYEDLPLLAKLNDCSIDHVKQGVAVGCFYLALCLQYGYVVKKDIAEAKNLIKKALETSTDVACDLHVKAILGTV